MKLNDNLYNILKWVALLLMPSLATLYGVIGQAWGLPYVEQIVITINAIGVFIGALIGISNYNYNKEE